MMALGADPDARQAVVAHFDYLPASQVEQIVERYATELRLAKLRENPRVMRLARMAVGKSVFWDYPAMSRAGRCYLQSADIYRAREVLEQPKAAWRLANRDGMPVVTRVR